MSVNMENDPGWRYLRLSRERMTTEQSMPFDSKKDVWIPDKEEGFVAAKVIFTKGDVITVSVNGKELTLKKDYISPMNPPKFEKTEDMSNLTILNDACVLHNLRARYKEMLIYTYSGLFCVVINPYKRLPIYTDSVAEMYIGKRRTEMPPHLFAVSDEAYRNMLQDHENQSLLITGESGAGKTENTKKVIAYFAMVASKSQTSTSKITQKKVTLEDQIIQTNPVLEAFGNARTVRNNNSSRFGKFIRIHFSKLGKVASCDIEHYLLEKSRVIRQAPGERCYHIFYQMCSDYKPELKPLLLLDRPLRDYWFVAQAELTVDGMDDTEEFKLTDEAFDILHFSAEEKMNCYKLMAGHMHIGIMKFKQRPREEQAEPDGTEEAEKAAEMYGVETEDLLKSFTHPRVKVGNEWVNKGQNVDQVNWAVGAMGKAIYARVFNWLVNKCNEVLDQKGTPRDYFIGVLDIAGFEIFDFNSFEQLWINFVNEKLQQFFNHHMFVLEQEEYARENIEWTFIDFGLDLQACIELIEKPLGIISMLDEECIVPKATDMTLAQKLNEQHLGKHPNFQKPKPPKGKQAEAHFAMHHYAGIVRYNVTNWLEKNKDPLNDTVAACLKASPKNKLLNEIWADYVTQEETSHVTRGTQKKKGGSFMTVSMMYRESLNNLMSMLYRTHPHFIRCIIPNEKKKSGLLEAALVLNQLTCNGVLEGIRICRKGFPNRMLHPDFVHRYAILCADESKSSADAEGCAIKMLQRLVNEGALKDELYRMGLTKVFFKAGVLAHLEDLRDERLSVILTALQAKIKYFLQQLELKDRRQKWEATQLIQKNAHIFINIITWDWFILFVNTMPIVRESKVEETLEQLRVDILESKTLMSTKHDTIKTLQERINKAISERDGLFSEIQNSRSGNLELEEEIEKIRAENLELENVLNMTNNKLGDEHHRTATEVEIRKKMEADLEDLCKSVQNTELNKRKCEAEKLSLENQIKALKEEIAQQDETIAKVTKERKHQDEQSKKLQNNIEEEEGRSLQGDIVKDKLKKILQECEERYEHEKRYRNNIDKAKRKADGALKMAQESMEELEKQRRDLESNLRKKEVEAHASEVRIEDIDALIVRIDKQNRDEDARVQELEQVIENERQGRIKSERTRSELQHELDEITNHLDEQNMASGHQIELGKKHEAEIAELRRHVECFKIRQETNLDAARKKNLDAMSELNNQISELKKQKERVGDDGNIMRQKLEQTNGKMDSETKARMVGERDLKQIQMQLSDMQMKCEEQNRILNNLAVQRHRVMNENDQLKLQTDELNEQINNIARTKTQYVVQIEEAEHAASEEASRRQNALLNVKNLQREVDRLRDLLNDELDEKNQLHRKINKSEIELQQMRASLEDHGLIPNETVEEMKRKQEFDTTCLHDSLDAATARLNNLEKTKIRLSIDADEACKEVDRRFAVASQEEKKQKQIEMEAEDWKRKADDMRKELDIAQRESRTVSAELFQEQYKNDSLIVEIEGMKRDNKNIADEIADLQQQLGEKSQSLHELQRMIHRLGTEKEELQQMLDEAEAALETEEMKVTRTLGEIKQTRAEAEKMLQEKEGEFDNVRKNLQRNLEDIQANTESERREKIELQKTCEKLQQDVTELSLALGHANEANEDGHKNSKRYAAQLGELQSSIDEEQRCREEARENFLLTEKSIAAAQNEKANGISKMQQMERIKKQNDAEIGDLRAQIDILETQVNELVTSKKKLDCNVTLLKNEVSETYHELRIADEEAKAATLNAAKLSEQLHQAQIQSQILERGNKTMEIEIKEMQNKINEAEGVVLRSGQKGVAKLEQRMKALNLELENEKHRRQGAMKNVTKQQHKFQEIEFQVIENKKKYAQMQEMVGKLQMKIKEQKKMIEEKEEDSSSALQKYKQLQATLEYAEERAQAAEDSLRMTRISRSTGTAL